MNHTTQTSALDGLVAHLNLAFGDRLLGICEDPDDLVTFDQFVKVAEGVFDEDPRRAAVHLAGLVAREIGEAPECPDCGARND